MAPAGAGGDSPDGATLEWAALVAGLRGGGRIVLACHVSPDGDALGSALAVGLALRALDVDVVVSFGDDPMEVPESLGHLPGQDLLVPPAEVPADPDVLVAFDTSSLDRLGSLAGLIDSTAATFAVDHHASYTGFAGHAVVDASAPATAVLAAELVDRLGVELTADIATCIYTGLVTDTGSFRFAGTTPATHELAARLLATGIRHDLIARRIYDTVAFGYLKVLAAALEAARLEESAAGGLGLVWTVVPAALSAGHDVRMEHLEGVIDVLRKAREAEVALVAKEDLDGALRISMRSKGAVDVSVVASGLGGGGHRYAAGFTTYDGLPATLDRVRAGIAAARDGAGPVPTPEG